MARRRNPIPLEHQRPRDLSKLQSRRVEPQVENKEMTFWISDPEEPRLPTFFEDWGIKHEGKDEALIYTLYATQNERDLLVQEAKELTLTAHVSWLKLGF